MVDEAPVGPGSGGLMTHNVPHERSEQVSCGEAWQPSGGEAWAGMTGAQV